MKLDYHTPNPTGPAEDFKLEAREFEPFRSIYELIAFNARLEGVLNGDWSHGTVEARNVLRRAIQASERGIVRLPDRDRVNASLKGLDREERPVEATTEEIQMMIDMA